MFITTTTTTTLYLLSVDIENDMIRNFKDLSKTSFDRTLYIIFRIFNGGTHIYYITFLFFLL